MYGFTRMLHFFIHPHASADSLGTRVRASLLLFWMATREERFPRSPSGSPVWWWQCGSSRCSWRDWPCGRKEPPGGCPPPPAPCLAVPTHGRDYPPGVRQSTEDAHSGAGNGCPLGLRSGSPLPSQGTAPARTQQGARCQVRPSAGWPHMCPA